MTNQASHLQVSISVCFLYCLFTFFYCLECTKVCFDSVLAQKICKRLLHFYQYVLRKMKLVDPILLPTTLQTFQFRETPEHLWEPNEVGPPDTSHCATLETGHVDTDGWRIPASLGLRSSVGMYWSDNQGKPMAQLGTDWQIDQIWQELLGLALSVSWGVLYSLGY